MTIAAAFTAAWAFVKRCWPALIALVLAAPLIFLLGQCDGKSAQRAKTEAKTAKAKLEQAGRDRAADSNLHQAKAAQDAAIAADRKEVDETLAPIPDRAPSARQRARACLELRRQARAASRPEPAC